MVTVTINDKNLYISDITKFGSKSRAILLKGNEILVANYGGVFLLPGGTHEEGESPKKTLIRELKEEIGIDYCDYQLQPFFTLEHYQRDYPTRDNEVINRLITTYYYTGVYKGINNNAVARTANELKDNFYLQLVNLYEIEELLNSVENNPRKQYFDREMREVIKVLKPNYLAGNINL